ncbi:MAG: YdbH domain-containing protein [Pseudomonadota bacterium]
MAHNRTRLLIVAACLTLIGVVSLSIGLFFLPGYLETRLIPDLAQKAGIGPVALHIRKMGVSGADLADVTVGIPGSRSLTIDTIRMDYSLTNLFRGRWMARICVTGLSFRVESSSGGLTVQATGTKQPPGGKSTKEKPAAAPEIILEARGTGAAFTGSCVFNLSSLEIGPVAAPRSLTITDISGKIPFQWPLAGAGAAGEFSAKSLQWQHLSLGAIAAAVHQREKGVVVSGSYNSLLLPGLSVGLSGNAALTENGWIAAGQILLPEYRVREDVDLGQFVKEAAGIFFKGEISLAADLAVSESCPAGSMTLGLRDARVKFADTGFAVDGLSMTLAFPEVTSLRSAPRQVLRVNKLSLGDIVATDFSADFQIESPTTLFIEQSRFNWCGGKVGTQAFRISPGADDYRLTLYCDRLKLAKILEQFGAAKAEGDGTVNGRVPVSFSGTQLTFQDGFLYSTPGDGGKIKLADTKILTAGLPSGSPEFLQMEIAGEALKDFEYSWVKMNLGTEGDTLLMQLKFDGKPAAPLPFIYQRDIGRFIRVEADAKGSVFQGIRLDVNFRLPLDDILKYKELLNKMK